MTESVFDSVVVISPYFWNYRDDMWQATHHVAQAFARRCPTIFIEQSVQWNPLNEHFRAFRLPQSLLGSRITSPEAGLRVFHRRSLPFGRIPFVRNLDLSRNAHTLQRLLKREGWRRTLLWHSFPYWSEPIVNAVDFRVFAYHCLDHSSRKDEEARLVGRADIVFCVSETLVEKHRAINPRTYLLANGVDLGLFNQGASAGMPRPGDLPAAGRVIGFIGSINCHLDFELLIEVAEAFPADHLVLVGRILSNETAPKGPQKQALDRLRARPNVKVLGFKPTKELPHYLNAFDVCLIPFLGNGFNQEADPLKFYQYTAMGKPIVTTSVPVAKRYADICYIASSPEEFTHAIADALAEGNDPARRQARLAVAQAHGWEAVVERACDMLARTMADGRRATDTQGLTPNR